MSGSVLALVTLYMSVTADCGDPDVPYKGYQFVLGKTPNGPVPWALSFFYWGDEGFWYELSNSVARGFYWALLALAVVTLVYLLASRWRPNLLANRKVTAILFGAAILVPSFLLPQFSFAFCGVPYVALLWVGYWLLASFVWLRFAWIAAGHERHGFPSASILAVLYVPQVPAVIALTAACHGPFSGLVLDKLLSDVEAPRLLGLVVYLLAAHLIALGYLLQLRNGSGPPGQELQIHEQEPEQHPSLVDI